MKKTKDQVLKERASIHGCCDRNVDQMACNCLEEATMAEDTMLEQVKEALRSERQWASSLVNKISAIYQIAGTYPDGGNEVEAVQLLKDERDALAAEVVRLKKGDFTEQEFQNLCHNFSADDVARFKQGCTEYQRKLFGCTKAQEVLLEDGGCD